MLKKSKKAEEHVQGTFDSMIEAPADSARVNGEQKSSALATYSQQPGFTSDDVFIPRLRLAQGLTAEVQDGTARPGQWLVTGFPPEEEVLLVPLGFARQRELRDKDTREMLCFSLGGEEGTGEPGGVCAGCIANKWTEEGDKRRPPTCSFSYNYIVYSEQHETLVKLTFQRMALNAGKMLNTIVAHQGIGNVVVKLSQDQRKGPKGTYYVPRVAVVATPPEGLLNTANESMQRGF